MANVHGFGGNPRRNPEGNPGGNQGGFPARNNNQDDNDPNFLGGFTEPVLEEQLRIAE